MSPKAAKAKGRRLSSYVRAKFLEWAPDLSGDNIVVTPSSVNGPDIYLSPEAKKIYNYTIECKMQERLSIHEALAQSQSHVKGDETPLLVFSRNRSDVFVALKLEDFLRLTQ